MRKAKGSEGILAVVLAFMLIIVSILAAVLGMQRQRAPMAANVLKRMQAYYYAEAALYETFNRFRNNTPPYNEWDPEDWANGVRVPTTPVDTSVTPNIVLVSAGGPVVRFFTPTNQPVDVIINCRRDPDGTGKIIVDAAYDYHSLSLQTP